MTLDKGEKNYNRLSKASLGGITGGVKSVMLMYDLRVVIV
jgi:hypothetical protein